MVNATCEISSHGACATECLAELDDAEDAGGDCVDAFTDLNVCLSQLLCVQMEDYLEGTAPFPCEDEHDAYYGGCQ